MNGTEFARISGNVNVFSCAYIGTWELIKQDPSTLLSTVKLRGYIHYWGGTTIKASGGYIFYLDGTIIKQGDSYEYGPGYHLIGEKTITIKHEANGSYPGRNVEIKTEKYTHFTGSSTGYITNIPPLVMPINKKGIVNAYIKQSGAWKRVIGYIKVNGAWKKSKEYLKEGGVWK